MANRSGLERHRVPPFHHVSPLLDIGTESKGFNNPMKMKHHERKSTLQYRVDFLFIGAPVSLDTDLG